MLPKHYQAFSNVFPELTVEEHEMLFSSGLITPGHVRQASREEVLLILPQALADKVKPLPKKAKVSKE